MKFGDKTWKLMNVEELEKGIELSLTYPPINNLTYEITITCEKDMLKVIAYRKDYHLIRGLTETFVIKDGKIYDNVNDDRTENVLSYKYKKVIYDKIVSLI